MLRQYGEHEYKVVWDPIEARQTRRDEYPLVGWVADSHRESNYAFLDALEAQAKGVVLLLGAWTDTDVSKATGIPVDEIVRARRIIGAEAMTLDKSAFVDRKVGPICEILRLQGKYDEALAVRRWMAGLSSPERKADRETPGAMWWRHESLFVIDMRDTRPMPTKNCYSCKWFRGAYKKNVTYQEFCLVPKGFERLVGRKWFHNHGGMPGFAPARRHTLCPSWTAPTPTRGRDLRQTCIVNGRFYKRRKPFGRSPAPFPLPEFRAYHAIDTDAWDSLMSLIHHRLHSSTHHLR